MRKILVLLLGLGLGGCATTDVVKISPDTYMVIKTGLTANVAALKAQAFRKANEFAESQKKIAIPLAVNDRPFIPYVQNPSVELQFRLVDENDPEAKRTYLVPGPDVIVQKDDSLKADININTKDEEKKSDLYTELMKLEDLRKKNILTEGEFQAQKKRLLENQR